MTESNAFASVLQVREIDTATHERAETVHSERVEVRIERNESFEAVASVRSRFDRENEIENEIEQFSVEPNIRT